MTRAPSPKHGPQQALRALAFVALVRGSEAPLNSYRISGTQSASLRILRGAVENGLARDGVLCHIISRDPGITHLRDRMESGGWQLSGLFGLGHGSLEEMRSFAFFWGPLHSSPEYEIKEKRK